MCRNDTNHKSIKRKPRSPLSRGDCSRAGRKLSRVGDSEPAAARRPLRNSRPSGAASPRVNIEAPPPPSPINKCKFVPARPADYSAAPLVAGPLLFSFQLNSSRFAGAGIGQSNGRRGAAKVSSRRRRPAPPVSQVRRESISSQLANNGPRDPLASIWV